MPHVGEPGCLLAPDLIGMGQSRKLEIAYRFEDQARYLEAWFDGLALDGVVLIGHDWGGALALDWAARHPRPRPGNRPPVLLSCLAPDHAAHSRRSTFRVKRWAGRARAWGKGGRSWIEQARGA
jgi:haloalkane dehalogenase